MITAIVSFLASTAFRMMLSELLDSFKKWQDNKLEMLRMEQQERLDQQKFEREQAAVKLQHDMGVDVIRLKGAVDHQRLQDLMQIESVKQIGRKTGVRWIDGWNGAIRPLLATIAIGVWVASMLQFMVLQEFDRALISAVLGLFIGGRIQTTGR